ncbi:uncharacterized protein LOC110345226 [Heterocephalus glaber]|uniref:Uncharacterized protein LOC110345226 n=1 Tax=Heterocephalus glaber TaxID=10181 RepID=A0AAX6RK64_HETGA|nr:uncharacterized protein LOC110345226 [Heterocephalus glaber]
MQIPPRRWRAHARWGRESSLPPVTAAKQRFPIFPRGTCDHFLLTTWTRERTSPSNRALPFGDRDSAEGSPAADPTWALRVLGSLLGSGAQPSAPRPGPGGTASQTERRPPPPAQPPWPGPAHPPPAICFPPVTASWASRPWRSAPDAEAKPAREAGWGRRWGGRAGSGVTRGLATRGSRSADRGAGSRSGAEFPDGPAPPVPAPARRPPPPNQSRPVPPPARSLRPRAGSAPSPFPWGSRRGIPEVARRRAVGAKRESDRTQTPSSRRPARELPGRPEPQGSLRSAERGGASWEPRRRPGSACLTHRRGSQHTLLSTWLCFLNRSGFGRSWGQSRRVLRAPRCPAPVQAGAPDAPAGSPGGRSPPGKAAPRPRRGEGPARGRPPETLPSESCSPWRLQGAAVHRAGRGRRARGARRWWSQCRGPCAEPCAGAANPAGNWRAVRVGAGNQQRNLSPEGSRKDRPGVLERSPPDTRPATLLPTQVSPGAGREALRITGWMSMPRKTPEAMG